MADLFVLHLSGPPCSGKTTLENELSERLPGTYIVSFDRMKWQLAAYDRTKDGPLVDELVMGLFKVVCEKKLPVILDFSFKSEGEYIECRRIAEQNGHAFFSIALTAPSEVLLDRFHKRIKDAKSAGAKVTITDDATFLETASRKFFLPPGTPVFDTSVTELEAIANQILKLFPTPSSRPGSTR